MNAYLFRPFCTSLEVKTNLNVILYQTIQEAVEVVNLIHIHFNNNIKLLIVFNIFR